MGKPTGSTVAVALEDDFTSTPEELQALSTSLASEALPALEAYEPVTLPDIPLPGEAPEIAFQVRRLMPPNICQALVRFAEAHGFRDALLSENRPGGGYPEPNERKCGMFRVAAPGLAATLW